ncbi:cbb3-type cytochrome c oxidase subunit I [Natronoarchaeum rubrum]|uniref:cbb3-type cytochrome c oxidase subunit I n=1 Tax=Natronoarchaeum rubrum TaxID=755311 RepID=UPI0035C11993
MASTTQLALSATMAAFLLAVALWLRRIGGWRTYGPTTTGGAAGSYGDSSGETAGETAKPGGLARWLTTVDHKDIGLLYGTFAVLAFAWGGIAVVIMRLELVTQTSTLIGASTYNVLLTTHGITMLFLFGTPILAAFANYLVPLLIDADDMAFPRINAIAFWLLPPAALLIWGGVLLGPFVEGIAGAQTSWTMYPPMSIESSIQGTPGGTPNPGADLMMLGLHLSGLSATMGAINFVATIFTERGEDVGWHNLDIFSWTVLVQSGIILFAFPLLGSAILMLLADRNLGTVFFQMEGGGPILWQHLFWFFGHPEVYVLVLPPMGIVSYVLPKFTGRKLFGFKYVVYSTLAIGVLSFGVWAHHMFASGMDPRLESAFMAVSLAIALPSAVKVFNWITTLVNGRIRTTAPLLFCVGFVFNFIIGGVTGVFEAAIPVDQVLHETYHVVGHFHYVIMGAIAFAIFAAIYYWFPLVTGRMYQRRLAKWHFWITMVGTNVTFFPMVLLGYGGMPRRYATYDLPVGPAGHFADLHAAATVGVLILTAGQLVFLWNFVTSWLEGPRVDDDPWDLDDEPTVAREYRWFRERRETASDGGSETASDGGSASAPVTAGEDADPAAGADEKRVPEDD